MVFLAIFFLQDFLHPSNGSQTERQSAAGRTLKRCLGFVKGKTSNKLPEELAGAGPAGFGGFLAGL